MILGSIVVSYFSRWREFRADRGGAALAGKQKMIGALRELQNVYNIRDEKKQSPAFQSMKISGTSTGFMRFFATHPPLEERIRRLEGN